MGHIGTHLKAITHTSPTEYFSPSLVRGQQILNDDLLLLVVSFGGLLSAREEVPRG